MQVMNSIFKNQQGIPWLGKESTGNVWIYVSSVVEEEHLVGDILEMLDEDELCRARSFELQVDRKAYITAHGLLRSVLSSHFPITPKDWNFHKSAFGKPEQVNFPGKIYFNISHTRSMVCCALSRYPIGIDTESIKAFDSFPGSILPLNSKEIADINQLPDSARGLRTAVCWTLRESLLKGTGEGISGLSKDFQFCLDEGEVKFKSNSASCLEQWQFVTYSINDAYIVSVSINPACTAPTVDISAPKAKLIGVSRGITIMH